MPSRRPVEDGPDYLRRTLSARGVRSHHEVVPKFDKRIESWPPLPNERVLFYIFHDEPHTFSTTPPSRAGISCSHFSSKVFAS